MNIETKNIETKFFIKVARNGGILAGLYFISVWATTQNLDFINHIKPILIFFGTYVLTECAKRYQIDIKNPKTKKNTATLIF